MQNIKEKVLRDVHLRRYTDLINKIAKVEYRSMGTQHLVEFEELINIGFQTINILCEQSDFDSYNESYLSTAIKWAIRNELRNRYRWYGVKQNKIMSEDENNELKGFDFIPERIQYFFVLFVMLADFVYEPDAEYDNTCKNRELHL